MQMHGVDARTHCYVPVFAAAASCRFAVQRTPGPQYSGLGCSAGSASGMPAGQGIAERPGHAERLEPI